MKGLLIKDYKLMYGQKNFFLVIVGVSLIMAITSREKSFPIGFLGFVCTLFTLSSISYDEYDNGNAFLFSLPITRKDYVLEKYVFGLLVGLISLLMGTVISILALVATNTGDFNDIVVAACTFSPVILLFLSLMIPLLLKFGAEKGKIAMFVVIGLAFVIGVVLVKAAESMGVDLYALVKSFSQVSIHIYILLCLLLSIIILTLSCYVSLAIIKKKEF